MGVHAFPAFPCLHLPICRHLLSGGFLGSWPLFGSLAGDNEWQQLPSPGTWAADCKPLNRQRRFCTFVFSLPAGTNFSALAPSGPWADTHNSIFRTNKRLSMGGIGHLHFLLSLQGLVLFPRTWGELANTWRPRRRSSRLSCQLGKWAQLFQPKCHQTVPKMIIMESLSLFIAVPLNCQE